MAEMSDSSTMADERPKQGHIAIYSVSALLVIFLGLVAFFVWVAMTSMAFGGNVDPTLLSVQPWIFPVALLAIGIVLLCLHWNEVLIGEAQKQRVAQVEVESRFSRAKSGFRSLGSLHKTHIVASHGFTIILVAMLLFAAGQLYLSSLRSGPPPGATVPNPSDLH